MVVSSLRMLLEGFHVFQICGPGCSIHACCGNAVGVLRLQELSQGNGGEIVIEEKKVANTDSVMVRTTDEPLA